MNINTVATRLRAKTPRMMGPWPRLHLQGALIAALHAVEGIFASSGRICHARRSLPDLMKRLHSIGVRVTETRPEITIAITMVTANSCSSRPTMPPMKTTRNEHRRQRHGHGQDGEGDFARSR